MTRKHDPTCSLELIIAQNPTFYPAQNRYLSRSFISLVWLGLAGRVRLCPSLAHFVVRAILQAHIQPWAHKVGSC